MGKKKAKGTMREPCLVQFKAGIRQGEKGVLVHRYLTGALAGQAIVRVMPDEAYQKIRHLFNLGRKFFPQVGTPIQVPISNLQLTS